MSVGLMLPTYSNSEIDGQTSDALPSKQSKLPNRIFLIIPKISIPSANLQTKLTQDSDVQYYGHIPHN